jgi:hypothetical protein
VAENLVLRQKTPISVAENLVLRQKTPISVAEKLISSVGKPISATAIPPPSQKTENNITSDIKKRKKYGKS